MSTTSVAWVVSGANFCLTTDISSFYEYVNHEILLDSIDPAPEHKGVVSLLSNLFQDWRNQHAFIGLPQGPDASGILGNAYLADLDTVCLGSGLAYARFSDDLRIFFRNESDARRFAPHLIHALRRLGLNISVPKTEVRHVNEIGQDEKSERRSAIAYGLDLGWSATLPDLREIFDQAIETSPDVDRTDLTFSLWRLGLLEDDYPLKKLLDAIPAIQFQASIVVEYLARVGYRAEVAAAVESYPFSSDNVHPWVEIQFLRLIGLFDELSPRLLERVRALAFEMQGSVGDFAARVLGKVGDPQDSRRLRQLAVNASQDSYRRRAALFGAWEKGQSPWAKRLQSHRNPPEVRRAAMYVMEGRPLPPTLVRRRTPKWVAPLRASLWKEGKIRLRHNAA
jgi:hypothetical protein